MENADLWKPVATPHVPTGLGKPATPPSHISHMPRSCDLSKKRLVFFTKKQVMHPLKNQNKVGHFSAIAAVHFSIDEIKCWWDPPLRAGRM